MKILHYSLGFAPYRTGGLTKFCMDVMEEQQREGNEVFLLWPGRTYYFKGKTRIRETKTTNGVLSYEVINPTPVSYDEGIKQVDPFMYKGDKKCYEVFLEKIKPDIIHIHTFMGMHINFLIVAKQKKIKIVYTAHDFFPICPKVVMFKNGQICESVENCKECGQCNHTALSLWKIQILQSFLYRELKDCNMVRKIRKAHRDSYLGNVKKDYEVINSSNRIEDYKLLRSFYNKMLNMVDVIHFNSRLTQNIYEKYMTISVKKEVITITHANIGNHKREKEFGEQLKITYMGSQSYAKGYYMLREALDILWKEESKISLTIFFEPIEARQYLNVQDRYTYSDLDSIFNNTDILVAPSQLLETFGYTILEALSYGVPVLLTKNVGAKDIVPKKGGIILEQNSSVCLAETLRTISPCKLVSMNKCIIEEAEIKTIEEMCKEIEKKCYKG